MSEQSYLSHDVYIFFFSFFLSVLVVPIHQLKNSRNRLFFCRTFHVPCFLKKQWNEAVLLDFQALFITFLINFSANYVPNFFENSHENLCDFLCNFWYLSRLSACPPSKAFEATQTDRWMQKLDIHVDFCYYVGHYLKMNH